MNILKSTVTKLENKIELIGIPSEENILVIGVFHGDEPQGKYLIEKYICSASPSSKSMISRRGLLFIPCLNPDGFKLGTRTNANGIDLNRNFPTQNFGQDGSEAGDNPCDYFGGATPASEVETQFIIDVIKKFKPKLVITLHAPYKIVNYDGPAEDIAKKISEIIGYPVEASIGYPTPGSFGTYCGVERNIPTITLELDEEIPVEQLEKPVFEIFDMFNFS